MKQFLNFLCAALWLGFLVTGCKKNNPVISYETKIDFTYNGQSYSRTSPSRILSNLIVVQNEFLLVNFAGLEIDDDAVLGGDIFILSKSPGAIQCAYFQPTGLSVHDVFGNCSTLLSGSDPIDSLRVYWYESGSLNFSYTDCKAVTNAIVSGQKDCAISGNFDLTLTNKNNQKMRLTNGSFKGKIRTYP
jgi:hypothetical protein